VKPGACYKKSAFDGSFVCLRFFRVAIAPAFSRETFGLERLEHLEQLERLELSQSQFIESLPESLATDVEMRKSEANPTPAGCLVRKSSRAP